MLTDLFSINFLRFFLSLTSLVVMGSGVWGQTEIFNLSGGGAFPSGWSGTNNNTGQIIEKGSYYLVESGNPGDIITTETYDLSTFLSATFSINVASYGNGSYNQAKVEISYDGGANYLESHNSSMTTGSSYNSTDVISLANISSQVKIRITNSGTSGRGVRLQNLKLVAIPINCTPLATITSFLPTSGPAETLVTISGSGFTGATQVKFGNTNAISFSVVEDTKIIAEVPSGISANETISVFDVTNCKEISSATFNLITTNGNCTNYPDYTDLFISEIYDSKDNNVWNIELYNPTSSPVVLDNVYQIKRAADILYPTNYSRTIDLTGTVPANSVFTIAAGDSAQTCPLTYDMTESGGGINEDDAIALYKNNALVDVTHAPNDAGYSLLRKINTGVVAPSSSYISGDWTVSSTEDCSDIGSYVLSSSNLVDISSSPADITNCTLTMSVSSSTPGVAYQWRYNDPSAMSGWSDVNASNITVGSVSGETTSTLTITGDVFALMDYQFYCEVSKSACSVTTNAAQFKIDSKPIYRSVASANGNWSDFSNWEMSTDNINYSPACTYPREVNSSEVVIQDGTNITYDLSGTNEISIDKVLIEENGTLEILASSKLTINDSVSGPDLIVNGTLLDGTGNFGSLTFSSGVTWVLGTNGTIIKSHSGAVALYRDAYDGGMSSIPSTANWIYRYDGNGISSVGSTNFFYPNLYFENTSPNVYSWNALASSFGGSTGGYATVKGDFSIGVNGISPCIVSNVNSNSQPMLIHGDLIIAAGSELINQNSTAGLYGTGIELKGDLTVNGALRITGTSEERVMRFTGNSDQSISGTGTIDVHKTLVDKASGSLILNRDYRSQNELVMTQGDIFTNNNVLELGENTTQIGSLTHTSGYVVGKMRRWFNGTNSGDETGLFPMGFDDSGLKNRNTKVEFTTASSSGGHLTVEYMGIPMTYDGLPIFSANTNGAGFDVTTAEDQGYWKIENQTGKLTDGTYKISCTGEGYQNITDLSKLTLLKRVGAGNWFCPGTHVAPAGTTAMPMVSRTGVTGWSNFGFGGGLGNPLPVKLTSFEVNCYENEKQININWSTASETNSSHYIVEKSRDMINWRTVAKTQAAGNSSHKIAYSEIDEKPSGGITYYRLSQFDFDGEKEVFDVVSVSCEMDENNITVYPNPSNGEFNIEVLWTEKTMQTELQILDITGRLISSQGVKLEKGDKQFTMNESYLQHGTYLIVFLNTELEPKRIVINK